jgi:hypothetical protein
MGMDRKNGDFTYQAVQMYQNQAFQFWLKPNFGRKFL